MESKKGQVGLDVAKMVMTTLLVIGLVAVVMFVILFSLQDTTVANQTGSGSVTNETAFANRTGYTLAQSTNPDFSFTITSLINRSDGTTITSSNYRTDGNVLYNATSTEYGGPGEDFGVTYTYNYDRFKSTGQNITSGVTNFTSNAGTWFTLIAVAIIVLVAAIILVAVKRFGGGRSTGV